MLPAPPAADNGRQSWTFSTGTGWTRLRIEARGRIELTDDEKDVKSVSANGSFEISSKGWLSLFGQRYAVRGNADGTTTRRFNVGGVERPIDAEARAWIADTIQHLVRNGFGAEARVARILASQGPSGVLDEIARFDSNFIKARYFALLLQQQRLDRPTAERTLRLASSQIGSDFELARVLIAFVEAVPLDETLAPAFVEAANAIGSDFEHARALRALMARQQTPVAVKAVLASTPRIGSDFEKGRVLRDLAQRKDIGADAVSGIVRATASIGSDFEHARVLLEVIASQPIDAAARQALLDTTGRIGSDHERGRVMSAMLREGALR
ncbi:MAG: hypothetical protein A3G76_15010 [Acidobacteria bacterium RIFCSPLOWO2_12_FULL_65_11]|nr:MAG: hypothetical protein A3H95_02550 [Acidobacteria bacterium RIFCSPLOWO2_02_FULL_64_15]OFW28960.1 MAG: hypothetical protein A3G76_15010 [Acidobacteria bacterium RIFCSPLOWO2_12_FULL_65_11]